MLVEEEVKTDSAGAAGGAQGQAQQAQQLQQQQQQQSPGTGPATDDDAGAGVPPLAPVPKGKGAMIPAAQVGRSTATLCTLDYDKPCVAGVDAT